MDSIGKKRAFLTMSWLALLFLGQTSRTNHIINETNRPIRIRMLTAARSSVFNIPIRQSLFITEIPLSMTIFTADGSCSRFDNIGMNNIFERLVVRQQPRNPHCVAIGFAGKTRQKMPQVIRPIGFDPDECRSRCWNPHLGTVFSEYSTVMPTSPPH